MQSFFAKKAGQYVRRGPNLYKTTLRHFSEQKKTPTRTQDLKILLDIIKCDKKGFYKVLGATAITSIFNLLFASAMKELEKLLPDKPKDPLQQFKESFFQKEKEETKETPKEPTDKKEAKPATEQATGTNVTAASLNPSTEHAQTPKEEEKSKEDKIKEDKQKVINYLIKWGFVFTLSGLVTFYRRFTLSDYVNRVAVILRYRLYNVLLTKNYSFFVNNKVNSAQFVQKIGNDISSITWNLGESSASLVRGIVLSVGGITLSILSNPELALVSVGVMTTFALTTRGLSTRMRKAKVEEMEELTKIAVLASERLSNMKFVKVNNTEDLERLSFIQRLQNFYKKSYDVTKYTAYNYGVMDGFGQIALFTVIFYGFYLSPVGIVGPEMISFLIYGLFSAVGIRSVFNSLTELEKTASIYRSIHEIIKDDKTPLINIHQKPENALAEVSPRYRALQAEKLTHAPEITMEHVSFGFSPDKWLLENFSMTIRAGEVVALIGPSGSGKTTVLNLITKLLDPQQGRVLIDGQNISDKNEIWVRSNVSYVTQEPVLFQGTIEENLKYGNEGFDLSKENLERACELANAKGFIDQLPHGFQTFIGEKGLTLSGGQRQKLALARALVKDPKILILDESTSSLDHESEKAIIEELKNICKGRTCIIVTHKLENFKDLIHRCVNIKEIKDKPQP